MSEIQNEVILIGTINEVTVGNEKHRCFLPTKDCKVQLKPNLQEFVNAIDEETKKVLFANLKAAFNIKPEEKFVASQWEKCVKLTNNAIDKKTIGKTDWSETLYIANWAMFLTELELNKGLQKFIAGKHDPTSPEGEEAINAVTENWDKAFETFDLYLDLRDEEIAEAAKAAKEAEAAAKAEAEKAKSKTSTPPVTKKGTPPAATKEEIPEQPKAETGVVVSGQNMQTANNASVAAMQNIFSGLEKINQGMAEIIEAGKAAAVAAAATSAPVESPTPVVEEEDGV